MAHELHFDGAEGNRFQLYEHNSVRRGGSFFATHSGFFVMETVELSNVVERHISTTVYGVVGPSWLGALMRTGSMGQWLEGLVAQQ